LRRRADRDRALAAPAHVIGIAALACAEMRDELGGVAEQGPGRNDVEARSCTARSTCVNCTWTSAAVARTTKEA